MKGTIALTLIGIAAGAPLQFGKFVEGTPEHHRPGSYVPGWAPGGLKERDALQSGKFVEGTPKGHQPGSYVPGWSPAINPELLEKFQNSRPASKRDALQSGKFVEGTPKGHRPGSYVPGWNPLGSPSTLPGGGIDPELREKLGLPRKALGNEAMQKRDALQSGKFVEGTPKGHRPGSYVPGWSPTSLDREQLEKLGLPRKSLGNEGLQERDALQSGKFVEGTPKGHRPGSYVPGWNPLGNPSRLPGGGLTREQREKLGLDRERIGELPSKRDALQSGKFVEGTPKGHRPGSYVPGWVPGGINRELLDRFPSNKLPEN